MSTQVTTAMSPWPRFPLSRSAEFICVVPEDAGCFCDPTKIVIRGHWGSYLTFLLRCQILSKLVFRNHLIWKLDCYRIAPSFFFTSTYLFWPRWIFVALQAFSSCRDLGLLSGCRMWASHLSGVSCCTAPALG